LCSPSVREIRQTNENTLTLLVLCGGGGEEVDEWKIAVGRINDGNQATGDRIARSREMDWKWAVGYGRTMYCP